MSNVREITAKITSLKADNLDLSMVPGLLDHNEISAENLDRLRDSVDDPMKLYAFRDVVYFFFIPSLCFQLEYPRSPEIRKWWLLKRVIALAAFLALNA